ncbi:hypothetical protein JEQ21_03490 [Streptococcus sp. 121]|nr:hypothetical protein [Streptococcus sp. 121]MBJ6745536.1 hypothetical protein [Streptococcus sp. 121]
MNPRVGFIFIGNKANIACLQSDEDRPTGLGELLNLINKASKVGNQLVLS